MLVTTTENAVGYQVKQVLGHVFGMGTATSWIVGIVIAACAPPPV